MGIRVSGKSKKELFVNAGRAFSDILTGLTCISGKIEHTLKIRADNPDDLLFNFLDELLYRFSVKKYVYGKFKVLSLNDKELNITAIGERLNQKKHKISREIKAITYHNFKINKTKFKWVAKILFDV